MRRFTSFVAVAVMFLMMLPALACATTMKMSRMEQNCCWQMHNQCGEMAKLGCCQVEVRTDLHQLPSHVVSAPDLPVADLTILHAALVEPPVLAGHPWRIPNEHSPPGPLAVSTTVLRI